MVSLLGLDVKYSMSSSEDEFQIGVPKKKTVQENDDQSSLSESEDVNTFSPK